MTEDLPPSRSVPVTAAAVLFSAVTVLLLFVVLLATYHMLSLGSAMSTATAATGLTPVGVKKLSLYMHDGTTIVVGVGLLIVMVRAGQRLYRGSASGRTTVVVLSIVLSLGCLISDWMWGATVNSTGTDRFNALDRTYMASLISTQKLHALAGADSFVSSAIVAVPLTSLLVIILLNLPASREYFNAMLRSGTF